MLCTHRLCDPLAEDGQQEEGSDGRGQVAGDRLDVVEELPAVGALDDGDPEDADEDQDHHKHSAGEHRALREVLRAAQQGGEWEPGREKGEDHVATESETDRRPGSQMQRLQKFIFVKSQNIRIIEPK